MMTFQAQLKGSAVWADHMETFLPKLRVYTAKNVAIEDDDGVPAIVFIEPRCHPSSEFVLRNFRHAIPSAHIIIVHGLENEDFMKTIVNSINGTFSFVNSYEKDLAPSMYNALLTSPSFWKKIQGIGGDWICTAQTDTVMLQPATEKMKELISKNVKFIGAPWSYTCNVCQHPLDGGCGHMIDQAIVASIPSMVGNGGLSFRHVPTILHALDTFSFRATPLKNWPRGEGKTDLLATNEDVFYSKAFTLMGETMPTRAEALAFCVEQVAPFSMADVPLGAHKPWVYLPHGVVKSLLAKYIV